MSIYEVEISKWYEKPLRIAALQCESEGDSTRVLDAWSRMGCNVEQLLHISAEEYHGYFREDQVRKIREYIANAKTRGLRIIFYLGVCGPPKVRDNQDWAFRDSSGKSLSVPCVNSPFHGWYVDHVRKVAALDIDGVFLDGPFFPVGSCYCKYCEDLFRQTHDSALPTVADFSDKLWRDFLRFRCDSITRLVRDARNALKSVRPEAIFYTNAAPLGSGNAHGRNNRLLIEYEDLLGAEGGFIFYEPPDRIPWWKPGVTARLLEGQAGGKPTVVFIAGDQKTWHRYLHTASETRLLIAATVANGANPWYGIHSPIEDLQAPGGQAAGEMMRFLRDNETYYTCTKSLADTALLWSQRTADYFGKSIGSTDFSSNAQGSGHYVDYTSCFGGFAEILLRRHIPFDVIDEQKLLEGELERYKTIILPNFACASDEEIGALQDYVRAGGNAITSFETSLYRPDLSRRPDFGLAKVFGAALGTNVYDFQSCSYLSSDVDGNAFAGIIPKLLPAPSWGLEVRQTTATPWAHFHEPIHAQYLPLPPRTTPAFLLNRCGKGQCVYIAGNFGEHFKVYGIPDYPVILDNILATFSPPIVRAQNLPETVELTLRVQRGRLIIHLVNFTGTMRRPISNVVKIHNAIIEVPRSTLAAADIKGLKCAYALRAGIPAPFVETSSGVAVTVPPFDEYEVLSLSEVAGG